MRGTPQFGGDWQGGKCPLLQGRGELYRRSGGSFEEETPDIRPSLFACTSSTSMFRCRVVGSFSRASAGGLDGITAQTLKDAWSEGESSGLWETLPFFVNALLRVSSR